MATRLYVGNLPYSASQADLMQLFAEAGRVESVALPSDHETGRPRGFGFVEMGSPEEAEKAIEMFNGYSFEGRQLRVNIAQEREFRSGGGQNRRSGGGYGRY